MAARRREALRPYLNRWGMFSAHIAELSTYHGEQTILLTQVHDAQGCFMTNHIWVIGGLYGASVGDNITFQGYVSVYTKGYRGGRSANRRKTQDYRIEEIKHIKKVNDGR